MKPGFLAILLWALLSIVACRRLPVGPGVVLVTESAPGQVVLESTGTGPNLPAIEHNALVNALNAVVLTGLPSAETSVLRQPLASGQTLPEGFMDSFVAQGYHTPFVSNLRRISLWRRRTASGGLAIRYAFAINYAALRYRLEQLGVIRKLGY